MSLTLPRTPSPFYEVEALVVSHERVVGAEYEIVFHAPAIAESARAGQFVEVLFGEGYAPLVRRPFSIFRANRDAGTCSILYVARGSFTSALARKQVSDRLSVVGPLGNRFQWELRGGSQPVLIAGGIGAPPITFLAREMCEGESSLKYRPVVINAAKTRDLLVGQVEFGALEVSLHAITEDGSHGRQGRATELLREIVYNAKAPLALYACGPMPLLKAISDIAQEFALPCQVSVETPMPCGIGVCNSCAIAVHDLHTQQTRTVRACWEGPVFEASNLVWEGY